MKYNLTSAAEQAMKQAKASAASYGQAATGTEFVLMGLLLEKEGTAGRVLEEAGVSPDKLMQLLTRYVAPRQEKTVTAGRQELTPRAEFLLENAREEAAAFHQTRVGTDHILLAMIKDPENIATRLLRTMKVDLQMLFVSLLQAMGLDENEAKDELQNLRSGNGENSSTPALNQFSRDLTRMAEEGRLDPVIGRQTEINRIIRILSRRTKNNPCLTGEPGVGKTAIVEGLAQRIVEGTVPETISGKRVLMLDLSGMVAGTKYRGEFEERIKGMIQEVASHKNILLFIDELHTIIGAGGAEGAMDAANILKPALSRGEIQIIGATTIDEYRKYIEKDAALERRFQPVTVAEPTEEETLDILKGLQPLYEKHHGVKYTEEALKSAVALSARYINDRFMPDKAIDLMDEAGSLLRLGGSRAPKGIHEAEEQLRKLAGEKEAAIIKDDFDLALSIQEEEKALTASLEKMQKRYQKNAESRMPKVGEEHVAEVVSGWTKIPVSRLTESESRRLLHMERLLHKRVVGQNEAVEAVSKAIRRGRAGLKDPARPIGSFMFLGPTGVGKTELSKALAEAVFGSEKSMIRVDMSEYMEKHSVSKLIGSPPGYVGHEEGGQLSEAVRRNPYTVILFDEIEKAHPDVFNILLHVLDEGHITDSQGRKIDFKQTIIIMTSNTGAQAIMEPKRLGFGAGRDEKQDYEFMKTRVMDEVKQTFRPEFINRIDHILVFHPLNKEEIRQIVAILLRDLEIRCRKQVNINLKVRSSLKEHLAGEVYDSKFGARPLKRAIQTQVEDVMAEELLAGHISRGDIVYAAYRQGKVCFIPEKMSEARTESSDEALSEETANAGTPSES